MNARVTKLASNTSLDHSLCIYRLRIEDTGHYLCIETTIGNQGTLLAGHQITVVKTVTGLQFPAFMASEFPQFDFPVCNDTWTKASVWCTLDYDNGTILVSSVPVNNNSLVFYKQWEFWKLALSFSYRPVITCVAPPYALLIGDLIVENTMNPIGYNITCVNCIFSSCVLPVKGSTSVMIMKQPSYVMLPVNLSEPWYHNTGMQAWLELTEALKRPKRFIGVLICAILALAALTATAATAGIALSQTIHQAHYVNQLSKNTSVALALQSHIDTQLKTEVDELKNVLIGIGDQVMALKLKMRLICHAKYTWICVTQHLYNDSQWDWEKVKMHILSVWTDGHISLDIQKLNAEIQAIQEAHLDEDGPQNLIQGLLDQLQGLNPIQWIHGGLSGLISIGVLLFGDRFITLYC
ncbi:endogenous retrovirus group K member 13-1 Env polyprotein-like [Balaenoptera ricei]|uniref:endogenous retrovirus group K member 13-1 Env polyprotein-like n=1 Tax=Balaenoptera ricei TaxID=2746895 RepID=UPI0028BDAA4A|nr:endogenous retrovirus group K member 13-1 Env polyprotein-like [Balaenoptera ricei]